MVCIQIRVLYRLTACGNGLYTDTRFTQACGMRQWFIQGGGNGLSIDIRLIYRYAFYTGLWHAAMVNTGMRQTANGSCETKTKNII